MNHLGLYLKGINTSILLLFLSFTSQGFQGFSGITAENYESVIAHLACEYEIDIPLEEVTSFIEGYIFFGESGCGFPVPRPIDYQVKSQSFEWDAIPNVKSFNVGSLGLKNGDQTHQKTNKTKVKVSTLTPQLQLFAFVSNCLYGGRSQASIIIIDKDVLFPEPKDEPDLHCDCLSPPQPLAPRMDCPFFEATSFAWNPTSSDCQYNKYLINITGSDNYFRSVPFVKIRTQSGGEIINPMGVECNNDIYSFDTKKLGVSGRFNILFSSVGVHVYEEENESVSHAVEGFDCGCADDEVVQIGRLTAPDVVEIISIAPNPVKEQLTIQFESHSSLEAQIVLYAMNGQVQFSATRIMDALGHGYRLNTADLKTGIYILEVTINGKRYQEKIIKI